MDPVGTLLNLTPNRLKRAGVGTPAESAVKRIRFMTSSFKQLEIETPCGQINVAAPSHSYMESKLNTTGSYEPLLIEGLADEFGSSTIFFDVGSAFDVFTKLAVACGVSADDIHAFEADKYRIRAFRETHSNEPVNITHGWCSDQTRESERRLALDDYSSLPPTVLKIDVEGAEIDVLRGSTGLLRSNSPTIFVEVHPSSSDEPQRHNETVLTLLKDLGYTVRSAFHRGLNTWEETEVSELPSNRTYLLRAT